MNSSTGTVTKKSKNFLLTEGAICIALSTVLSLISIIKMPLGGSVTLLSMMPVCVYSLRHGIKYGLFAAFVYSLLQLFLDLGAVMSWGITPLALVGCFLFDYILAFTSLGLAGIFGNRSVKNQIFGVIFAIILRFFMHIISGTLIFACWMPEEWNSPLLYSVCYNGAYMLPELITTSIAAPFIVKALSKIKK